MAHAYLDQLRRTEAVPASLSEDITAAFDKIAGLDKGKRNRRLAARLDRFAKALQDGEGDAMASARKASLTKTLGGIAARLRG